MTQDTAPERHANKSRNLILNKTLTDLDDIINGHDPEIDTSINNGVWDRLDKMAIEIEELVRADLSPTTGEREATAHECEAEIVGVNPFTVALYAEKAWMTKADLGAVRVAIYDALQASLFINEHGDIEGVSTASHAAIAALIDTPTPPAAEQD